MGGSRCVRILLIRFYFFTEVFQNFDKKCSAIYFFNYFFRFFFIFFISKKIGENQLAPKYLNSYAKMIIFQKNVFLLIFLHFFCKFLSKLRFLVSFFYPSDAKKNNNILVFFLEFWHTKHTNCTIGTGFGCRRGYPLLPPCFSRWCAATIFENIEKAHKNRGPRCVQKNKTLQKK